jgi:polyisoprenoid-binding protein YceI
MKNSLAVLVLLSSIITLLSCHNDAKSFIEYKMISYESKAWVDTASFPTIKIFKNNDLEVSKNGAVKYKGDFIMKGDSAFLQIKNSRRMAALFLNKEHTMLRISNLTSIEVEAWHGDFKKAQ